MTQPSQDSFKIFFYYLSRNSCALPKHLKDFDLDHNSLFQVSTKVTLHMHYMFKLLIVNTS
jgi:hypothetical protein